LSRSWQSIDTDGAAECDRQHGIGEHILRPRVVRLDPPLPDVEFVAHVRPGMSEENTLLTRSVIDWITANRPK